MASIEYCVEYTYNGTHCNINVFASSPTAAKRQVKRMDSSITIISVTAVG